MTRVENARITFLIYVIGEARTTN